MDIVTLTGRYVLADGSTPATGVVTITLSTPLHDATGNVIATTKEITKPLIDGAFTVALVATTSPGITPSGATYRIVERLGANGTRTYSVELPHDSEGATADLADLAPVTDSTITYGVTLAAFDAHKALTTGVHGIADTSALETTTGAQAKADAAQAAAASGLAAHEADTTGIHGIADTALIPYKNSAQTITGAWDFTGGITQNGAAIGGNQAIPEFIVAAASASAEVKAVADYVCDGVDDDVEINAAIIAANTAGGGVVFLTTGLFTCSLTIDVLSNTVLQGSGWATEIFVPDTTPIRCGGKHATPVPQSKVAMRDFTVYSVVEPNSPELGIVLISATDVLIEHVNVHSVNDICVYVGDASSRVMIRNCWFHDWGNSYAPNGQYAVEIDGKDYSNGQGAPSNVSIIGCQVSNGYNGFSISTNGRNVFGIIIADNNIDQLIGTINQCGIIVSQGGLNAVDCVIANNRLYQSPTTMEGIKVRACVRVVIANNLIRGFTNGIALNPDGVVGSSFTNLVCTSNIVTNCNTGFYIPNTSTAIQSSIVDGVSLQNNITPINDARVTKTGLILRGLTGQGASETAGAATITSAATSVVVSHGLYGLPVGSIQVTPTSALGAATKFWVSGITGTQFTLNVDAAPGSSVTFGWSARMYA